MSIFREVSLSSSVNSFQGCTATLTCVLSTWKQFFSPIGTGLPKGMTLTSVAMSKAWTKWYPQTSLFINKTFSTQKLTRHWGQQAADLISQAEKSFFTIACRLSFHQGVMFKDLSSGECHWVHIYVHIITLAMWPYMKPSNGLYIGCNHSTEAQHYFQMYLSATWNERPTFKTIRPLKLTSASINLQWQCIGETTLPRQTTASVDSASASKQLTTNNLSLSQTQIHSVVQSETSRCIRMVRVASIFFVYVVC